MQKRNNKPFKNDDELIEILINRGLHIDNLAQAKIDLKNIGYHRLGGYRYPFRELLPDDERNHKQRKYRYDSYIPGSSFEEVVALAKFDERLRQIILEGTFDFETKLRASISRTLGERSPDAHINSEFLNKSLENFSTKHPKWEKTVTNATERAHREERDDFAIHHDETCSDPMPVWSALEYVTFGNLPFLLDLLLEDDQRKIAKDFGVKREKRFIAWVRTLVNIRNRCAHGARIFNRPLKYTVTIKKGDIDFSKVTSLSNIQEHQRNRIYAACTLLAYMLNHYSEESAWAHKFVGHAQEILKIKLLESDQPFFSLQKDMGFSDDWESDPIWQIPPREHADPSL